MICAPHLTGATDAPESPVPKSGATLIIDSPHYGATVYVDRRAAGHVPLGPVPVAAGLHLVEVVSDGRPDWRRVVYLGERQVVRVSVHLGPRGALGTPRAPSTPHAANDEGVNAPALESETLGGRRRVVDLQADVGVAGALNPDGADVDLTQRWRIDAAGVGHESVSGAVELRGYSDLAGRDESLLRGVDRGQRTAFRLDELRLTWRSAAGARPGADGGDAAQTRIDLGRFNELGPGAAALVIDGARGALTLPGGLGEVDARVGQRAEPLGPGPGGGWFSQWGPPPGAPGPHDPRAGGALLAGATARVAAAPWLRLGGGALWHQVAHADLTAHAVGPSGDARIVARWLGGGFAEGRLDSQWRHAPWRLDVRSRWRTGRAGPLEDPARWAGLLDGPAAAFVDVGAALHLGEAAGWAATLGARTRNPLESVGDGSVADASGRGDQVVRAGASPGPDHPRWIEAHGALSWRWRTGSIDLDTRLRRAEIGPPAPRAALVATDRLSAGVRNQAGPWSYAVRGGAARLDLQDDTGDRGARWLPEGSTSLGRELGAGLSLFWSVAVAGVHPAWFPGGGPLGWSVLELRLR